MLTRTGARAIDVSRRSFLGSAVTAAGTIAFESAGAADMPGMPQSGGDGGVIVLAPDGAYVMDFNSAGMFRAARQGDRREVAIYAD